MNKNRYIITEHQEFFKNNEALKFITSTIIIMNSFKIQRKVIDPVKNPNYKFASMQALQPLSFPNVAYSKNTIKKECVVKHNSKYLFSKIDKANRGYIDTQPRMSISSIDLKKVGLKVNSHFQIANGFGNSNQVSF